MNIVSSYFIGCKQWLLDISTCHRYPVRKFLVPSLVINTCAAVIANGDNINGIILSVHENYCSVEYACTLLTMEGNGPSPFGQLLLHVSYYFHTQNYISEKQNNVVDMSKSFIDQLSYFINVFELKIK